MDATEMFEKEGLDWDEILPIMYEMSKGRTRKINLVIISGIKNKGKIVLGSYGWIIRSS